MGADKALLPVAGVPMAARVARALAAGGCDRVVLVGGDRGRLAGLGWPWVADRWPGEGPLGGVLTALTECGTDVVVAACDLPDLDADTVMRVLGAAVEPPAVEVVVAVTDQMEPMLAWWSVAARPGLEASWAAGTRAVHEAIAERPNRRVAVGPAALRNVNRPVDLDAGKHAGGQTNVRS